MMVCCLFVEKVEKLDKVIGECLCVVCVVLCCVFVLCVVDAVMR